MAIFSSCGEDRDTYIGYFELVAGLGILFGPILGAINYELFGFIGPFYVLGFTYLICIVIFY